MAFSSVPSMLGPYVVRNVLCTIGAGALLRVEDVGGGRSRTVMLLDPDQTAWPARLLDRQLLPAHPRLCSLSPDAPSTAEHEDRTLYYVTAESLSGWTILDEIVRDGAIRPIRRAVRLCAEAAEALTCAHLAGLSHGHLEPGCLFVQTLAEEDEGHIKLLGVGLDVTAAPSSRAARYREADLSDLIQGDLYALGAVLYHMVLGHAPDAADPDSLVLPSMREGIPEELDEVVLRTIGPDKSERYASAAELREALLGVELLLREGGDAPSALTPAMRYSPRLGCS